MVFLGMLVVIAIGFWIYAKAAADVERKQAALVEQAMREQAERERPERDRLDRELTERIQRELAEERERLRAERERLRAIPTSSTNRIIGRQIIRQICMIVVDNHSSRDEAEREFLLKVEQAGGNAVINMDSRRHHGGYVSIQGDAVQIN